MGVPAIISDKFQQFFFVFGKVPQLQFIGRVEGSLLAETGTQSNCAEDRCDAQVQFLGRLGHARRCATTGWLGFTVQKTVEVPHVQYLTGWSMFRCSSSTRFGRSRDPAAAGSRSQSEVPQIQFVLFLRAVMGFFGAFCAIFRAPPVFRS